MAKNPETHEARMDALTHLAAGLVIVAVLSGIIGAVTLGAAMRAESSPSLRAAVAAPIALAAGASGWAWRARARIRALREADSGSSDRCNESIARPLAEELASEHAASRDLLAIDRTLRAYHRLPGGQDDGMVAAGALFTREARLELGTVDPRYQAGPHACSATEFFDRLRRSAGAPTFKERSRTVHVIGDVAIAISSFESSAPVVLGVNVIQLRRAGNAWLIHSIVAQPTNRWVTERSAAPRPPHTTRKA